MAYKKIYTDDKIEYQIRCEKCRRYVSAIGNIETVIKSFNEMNDGAIPIRFSVESAPQIITIFSKSEDDVDTLVEQELSKCVKLRRLTEGDFWALLHRQEIRKITTFHFCSQQAEPSDHSSPAMIQL